MKKFLPKRKTERKPSDEEFVIRKSKCCIFLFLFGGFCVLGDLHGTLRTAFFMVQDATGCSRCEQACVLPSTGGFWKRTGPQSLPDPLPVMTARHATTLLVIASPRSRVVCGRVLGTKPRN